MASFAVLSIGGRALDDQLETEARRLQQLLALAAEEAVLHGRELGFRHTPSGYEFLVKEPPGPDGLSRWVPVADDPALRARRIEDPLFLELRVEDRPVAPDEDTGDGPGGLKPQLLLLSSGETTAFSLRIHARNHLPYYQLDADPAGQLKLERQEPGS